MGAGILPSTIHNGKLYFLFGKENKYEDSAPGFSDFGGGTDNNETFLETAIREAGEEFTGFLGDDSDVNKLLHKNGTYNIDYNADGHSTYRMHIFHLEYNHWLPHFFNNNQQFLQKRLPAQVIKTTKIFEKAEIRWFCIDELTRKRSQFRHYFKNIIDKIIAQKEEISNFIKKNIKKEIKKNIKKTRKRKIN